MWSYSQSTGELLHDGTFQGTGYSGRDTGRNNPQAQGEQGVGPVPRGRYEIGDATSDAHLGPCIMPLRPLPDTDTLGRSGFFIHGDNARHDASHGCIILGPAIRHLIAGSADRDLTVSI